MAALRGGAVSYERGTPVAPKHLKISPPNARTPNPQTLVRSHVLLGNNITAEAITNAAAVPSPTRITSNRLVGQ